MKLSVFILSTILFCSSQSYADVVVNDNIEKMTEKFYQTMMVCPDKVWTDFSWNDLQVLFFQQDKQVSILWDATNNTFSEIENLMVPLEAQYGSYSFFDFQGKPTMSLRSQKGDFSGSYLFSLGVHEMFHYQGQKDWVSKPNAGGRYTEYPLDSRPRFLRRMIFDNLKNYFLEVDANGLEKARYWFDEWSVNYPNEVLSSTDGYEGSARYVDTMAEALVDKGCSATDSVLKTFLKNHVKKNMGGSVSGQRFGLDSEGYDIGGLSGLILRMDKAMTLSHWNDEMSQGATSLEIIMETVQPLIQNTPIQLETFFKDKELEVNKEWGSYLDQDIANWQNPSYVRVTAPFSMVNGSFSPMFFALSKEIDLPMFPFALDQTYISSIGTDKSNFVIKSPGVMISEYENPCGLGPVTLVHKDDLKMDELKDFQDIEMSLGLVVGRLVGTKMSDSSSMTYLCLE